MKKRIYSIVSLLFLLTVSIAYGQEEIVKVNDILREPSKFLNEEVMVEGLVIQYIEATERTTSHYYIKDNYGAIIKVHTAEPKPETNVKYRVKGILYIDQSTEMPFISEKSKTKLDVTTTIPTTNTTIRLTWWEKNWLLVVIIAGAILLLSLILLLFGRKRNIEPSILQSGNNIADDNLDKNEPMVPKDNLKTMIIPSSVPRTMKFIPGEFEVISGDDKGRIIKIGGYPTEEGSIVTIGREQVTGPRDFAHIQLKERTISRKQAEIILKDGKLYIKNLSETNYTKLNGKEIPPNTSAELISGSIITLGEVEMKYIIR